MMEIKSYKSISKNMSDYSRSKFMKPKSANRKIELKFMDCSVKLEGARNIESRALGLLSAMVQDRMKIQELMNEIDHEDNEESSRMSKKKKIEADSEFMKGYI